MELSITKGKRFGKLIVLSEGKKFIQPSGQTQRGIRCKCDCGQIKTIRLSHLRTGRVQSCGCLNPPRIVKNERLYNTWRGMIQRSTNHNYTDSHIYFDKGIRVCDEWRVFNVFANWAIENGWDESLTIDRKDSSLGYSPSNCRFVTQAENNLNRSNTFIVSYKGQQKPLLSILREMGKQEKYNVILNRIKRGHSAESAIDRPIRKGNYK